MTPSTSDKWGGPHLFETHIRCPHCGEEDEDRCDYPNSLRHDGDQAQVTCPSCDSEFTVVLCCEYSFASKPLPVEFNPDA